LWRREYDDPVTDMAAPLDHVTTTAGKYPTIDTLPIWHKPSLADKVASCNTDDEIAAEIGQVIRAMRHSAA
jgi:hypothetical protein